MLWRSSSAACPNAEGFPLLGSIGSNLKDGFSPGMNSGLTSISPNPPKIPHTLTTIRNPETSGHIWIWSQYVIMIGVLIAGPWGGGRWDGSWSWFVGIPLFLLGGWTGLRGKSDLGRQRITHPEPVSGGSLVTTGIYSRMRHPLYASLILLGVGWAVLWNSWPALALALVQGVFLDAKARCEERYLLKRFAGYAAYSRRVKRWIPGVY